MSGGTCTVPLRFSELNERAASSQTIVAKIVAADIDLRISILDDSPVTYPPQPSALHAGAYLFAA
jgi:hypothetical protein